MPGDLCSSICRQGEGQQKDSRNWCLRRENFSEAKACRTQAFRNTHRHLVPSSSELPCGNQLGTVLSPVWDQHCPYPRYMYTRPLCNSHSLWPGPVCLSRFSPSFPFSLLLILLDLGPPTLTWLPAGERVTSCPGLMLPVQAHWFLPRDLPWLAMLDS